MTALAITGALTGALAAVSSQASAAPFDPVMATYAAAIRKIESTGRYHVTANAGHGRTALGAYQILDTNLASWSRAALGRPVGREEFLRSPHLQDRVFHHRFHRFAFIGVPYAYADYAYYDDCWRRIWTAYGLQWTNVCGNYGYY